MSTSFARASTTAAPARQLCGWRIAGLAFCCLMLALHVVAGYNSAGVVDFRRDVYWATVIAYGEGFPWSGPPIYQLVELGPWWYYLLAPVLRLGGSIAVAAAAVQALAALKYFLALRLGTRLLDARFGVALAAGIAVTGWAIAPLIFPSHPAVVETTLWLLALAAWRCRDILRPARALLFGLAAAACVHAHPTTATWILAAGLVLLWRHRSWHALAMLGLAALVVVLSLLPPWLDPQPLAVGMRKAAETYASHDLAVDPFGRLARLLAGLFVNGEWSGLMMMTPWKLPTVRLAWALYCVCLAVAFSGVALLPRVLRRAFGIAIAALVLQCAFLVLVRANMPIWMLMSALPALAFALALGWYGWLSAAPAWRRVFGAVALGVQVALSLATFSVLLRDIRALRIMPDANPYVDATQRGASYMRVPIAFFPARKVDAFAAIGCAPMTLHGRLAALLEADFAVPLRIACGRWPDLRFRGADEAGEHLLGIESAAAAKTTIAADETIAGMAIYHRIRPVGPATGTQRTQLRRMQVVPETLRSEARTWAFQTHPRDVVSLTGVAADAVGTARADGRPAKLVYAVGNQLLYACDACAGSVAVDWEIAITQPTYNLDIVVIEAE
ncbi:MAG: hypothetical protein JSS59_07595 [Proteobacteria bacterium]|uniref:hypothetical protein n=1 Tax=Rudaea sp. TaxID=2136325 RepID=UPI003784FBEA|nr:hypothetical protein [Pseudomonadota bacterium]